MVFSRIIYTLRCFSKQNSVSLFCILDPTYMLNFVILWFFFFFFNSAFRLECSVFTELCWKAENFSSGPKHFASQRALPEEFFRLCSALDKGRWQRRGHRSAGRASLHKAAAPCQPLGSAAAEKSPSCDPQPSQQPDINVRHKACTLHKPLSWPSISCCSNQHLILTCCWSKTLCG